MDTAPDPRVQAWFHLLREAVDARDEPLYYGHVERFVATVEGAAFVQRNLDTPHAHRVMAEVYQRLAPAMGLESPAQLLEHMQAVAPEQTGTDGSAAATRLASTFTRYLRLGRDWTEARRVDVSYGVALALLMFEPMLVLFGAADEALPTTDTVRMSEATGARYA